MTMFITVSRISCEESNACLQRTSITGRRLPLAEAESLGDFAGLGQHQAGFTDHGDELPALVDAALRLSGIDHVDARRNAMRFGTGQDLAQSRVKLRMVAVECRWQPHRR